ncbi:hypothetical protein BT69DRAFT_1358257, partial [Atractiella rhizophila]
MSFFRTVSDSESETESEEELLYDSDGQERELKFVKGGGSDEESEEESEEEEESDEEEEGEKDADKPLRSRKFLAGASDSEDDESEDERKRTVKSAKDKRTEEMEGRVKGIQNAININDWTVVSDEFDKLTRLVTKQTTLSIVAIPSIYLQLLLDLDTSISEAGSAANKKKMNATNARGLNTMKQKVKKAQKEHEAVLL